MRGLLARLPFRRRNTEAPPARWEEPGRAPSALLGLASGIAGAAAPVVVPAVLALLLGRATRREIADSDGQLSGRGYSTAAFVLGIYSLVATPFVVASVL